MEAKGITPSLAAYTTLLAGLFRLAPRDECYKQSMEASGPSFEASPPKKDPKKD
jgi:hypothetical protein